MKLMDTNAILRFLVKDNSAMYEAIRQLFGWGRPVRKN
jgi:hypothetical protein